MQRADDEGEGTVPVPGATAELLAVPTAWERALALFEDAVFEPGARAARTGPAGFFALQAPFTGLWRVRVSAPGFVPMERVVVLPADRDLEPVTLQPDVSQPNGGPTLQVVGAPGTDAGAGEGDDEGRAHPPLAAWVVARPAGRGTGDPESWRPARLPLHTGEDGEARVARRRGEELEVWVWTPGHVERRISLGDGTRPPSLRVALTSEATVDTPAGEGPVDATLRVVDPDRGSAPVEGALLLRGPEGGSPTSPPPLKAVPVARSDAEGRIDLRLPSHGVTFRILLSPDGRRSRRALSRQDLAPRQNDSGQNDFGQEDSGRKDSGKDAVSGEILWPLPPAVTLTGRARDAATGAPVPGALVWFENAPGLWGQTDAEGSYWLPADWMTVPDARLALRAEAAGYAGQTVRGRMEPEPSAVQRGPLLALEPVVGITGRVVDEGGEPVVGAELRGERSWQGNGPPPRRPEPSTSGPGGLFRLRGLSPGVPYRITARAPGYGPGGVEVPPIEHRPGVEHSEHVEIVLPRGRAAVGRVVDAAGEPVAGARVALLRHAGARERTLYLAGRRLRPPVQVFETSTDEEGVFLLRDLPAGSLDLVVRAGGFAPHEAPGVEIPDQSSVDAPTDLGLVELAEGLAIQGRVTDPRGRPVPGAAVRMMRRVENGTVSDGGTTTGPQGRFRLEALNPGAVVDLRVGHPDYAGTVVPRVQAEEGEPILVELEPAAVLRGRVLSAAGEPIAGAWVGAQPEGQEMSWLLYEQKRGVDPTTRTDAEGRFELPDVEPGRLRVEVEARGYEPAVRTGVEVAAGGEAVVEITLEPGAVVTGRVLDPDGRPVSRARVSAAGRATWSDPQGVFELPGLPAGTHTFTARHEELGRTSRPVEVGPGGTPAPVELRFPRGVTVEGRVVDRRGEPVPGALVVLGPSAGKGEGAAGPAGERSRLTDRAGAFRFEHVQAGPYRLEAHREGFTLRGTPPTIDVSSSPLPPVRLLLESGALIVGQVLGLEPGQAGSLVVRARGAGAPRRGEILGGGSYRLEGLAPGAWTVTAEVLDHGRRAQKRVELEAGAGPVRVDLVLGEGVVLTGRVQENGRPLVDAEVRLVGPAGDQVARQRTDREGAFRVEGLEAGVYDLELATFGRELRYRRTVALETDRQLELDLPTGSLSGMVVDGGGAPMPRARVLLEPLAGPALQGPPRWVEPATDGTVSASRLLAGRYRVAVRLPEGEMRPAGELTIPAGSGLTGWRVEW